MFVWVFMVEKKEYITEKCISFLWLCFAYMIKPVEASLPVLSVSFS